MAMVRRMKAGGLKYSGTEMIVVMSANSTMTRVMVESASKLNSRPEQVFETNVARSAEGCMKLVHSRRAAAVGFSCDVADAWMVGRI